MIGAWCFQMLPPPAIVYCLCTQKALHYFCTLVFSYNFFLDIMFLAGYFLKFPIWYLKVILNICYKKKKFISFWVCVFQPFWGCLVYVLKQQFSVFKQHFTHFNAFFHLHVFPQIFLNNNFKFLNTHTKRVLCIHW